MKYIALGAAIILAGCAHKQAPGVEIRTVETVVTRVDKCVAAGDIPKRPGALPRRPSSDARVLADILLAKVRSWELYGDKADAVLTGCAG